MTADNARQPRYLRIAAHYRRLILDGELTGGEKLPPLRELAQHWEVAGATASKALAHLQVEGFLRTSPRGTFVADDAPVAPSAHDRLERSRRTGSVLAVGETALVTAAGLVRPPQYVAEFFGLDPGDQVVRREWVADAGRVRLMLAVSWYPAVFAVELPDLLSTAPEKHARLLDRLQEATGRTVVHARDDLHARQADAREAGHLRIPVGAVVLAGTHRWSDDQGLIEYGEWCLPARTTIGYEYDA
jgi:GntR family transcriptional regulator